MANPHLGVLLEGLTKTELPMEIAERAGLKI